VGPDGQAHAELVVEVTQTFRPRSGGRFRGGCTLLIDLEKNRVRYFVRKRVSNAGRLSSQLQFQQEFALSNELRANYFASSGLGAEPFAVLHRR